MPSAAYSAELEKVMKKGKQTKELAPHVVIFVEGDTDEVLFKLLVAHYREVSTTPIRSCEIVNMKGVSRYASSKLLGKLDAEIITKAERKGMKVYGVCCSYDTDVFEGDEPSVVDWTKVRKSIMKLGIEEFCTVEVKSEIEDWLLDDLEGICKYLKLKDVPKTLKGSNGYAKLLGLFKRCGKVYVKGVSVADFIDFISIATIRSKRKSALSELERILNVKIPS